MADDVRVRVVGRSFGYRGDSHAHGDELTVDQATAERHSRTLERLDDTESDTTDESDADTQDIDADGDGDESGVDEDGGEPGDDVEICGTEMSDGTICERPADECPYHA